jgi:hypothetical protein
VYLGSHHDRSPADRIGLEKGKDRRAIAGEMFAVSLR